ncbi:F5/8 type C domain-containing protein [Amycolatopsis xylanica]|uniref:F5/8 type C domain-containing protein n=1 Tax=Amycolatopsis xylanica TaxID=589385 RepID=A0A1H3PN72_9PSEU|nr:M36 family metallopeptidase [Amycolatopsis xylanica]SDZ02644.1 F5/8 type C domain-containing protein [Amycolatopsis xylanica]
MTFKSSRPRASVYAATAVMIFGLATVPVANAAPPSTSDKAVPSRSDQDFDVRDTARSSPRALNAQALFSASQAGVTAQARAELGQQARIDIDALTGTPRVLARTDGFLTGPSREAPRDIVLRYLTEHEGLVGLSASDRTKLNLRKDYVDVEGIHHLSFTQVVDGIPLFGNGLKAHVAKDGRLIQLDGSPVRGLPASLGASTLAAPGKESQRVGFLTADGVRPAWSTLDRPSADKLFQQVTDAQTGALLYRKNLVNRHEDADGAKGLAWQVSPGAAAGGKQEQVNLTQKGWLPADAKTLDGNVAHVGADVNGDQKFQPEEEIGPNADGSFRYKFSDFNAVVGAPCSAARQCSWDPKTPGSWAKNREQNAVQALAYVGTFHDHLASFPIGFTRAAGNFEKVDGDAVEVHTLLNAAGNPGSYDNAFMGTPPDGQAPFMGMFLFHNPKDPTDPFLASNSADDASIIEHEYTHGLSNRLVVDALGNSTLNAFQSGAMGEAWSDWYAFDYLVGKGLVKDTAAPGEIIVGDYVGNGESLARSQPLDCAVGVASAKCPGTPGAGPGGYTYGDLGHILPFPEVHADGEIWAGTLWDLRSALGVTLTRALVTRAMELSPASPSFLDMRNSILQADVVINGGQAAAKIWKTFAARGMGFFAGSVTGDDTAPAEDFSTPPPAGTPTATVTGKVVNADSAAPLTGVAVRFGGHDSGFGGSFAAVTGADGTYKITGVLPGTYPKVYAFGGGADSEIRAVSVRSGTTTVDWKLRQNWASDTAGATVAAFNGDDWTPFGCGPGDLLRSSPLGGAGWSTDKKVNPDGTIQSRFVTVKLGGPVNVSAIEIDPSNNCGDDPPAAAKEVTVETSVDGTTWVKAGSADFKPADLNALHPLTLAPGTTAGVRFLRLTVLSNQLSFYPQVSCTPQPTSAGCVFMDIQRFAVRGTKS